MRFTLPPPPAVNVTVTCNVHGAEVYVGKTRRGLTPVAINLEEGQHEIELRWGRSTKSRSVKLIADKGQTPDVNFTFESPEIAETLTQSVCLIRTASAGSHGSGFLVQDSRTIVTAAHVIDDARSLDELEFIFNPDAAASEGSPPQEQTPRLRGADLIHYDRKIDLAILRLREPISSTSPVTWLQPKVRRLTKVAAIGNPALLDNRISALEVAEGTVTNTSPLQADIKLRGGYSGGPVFTIDNGEVIGMVSANIELDATNPRSPGVGQKISILVSASAIQGTLQAWLGLSETERQSRVTRLGEWFRMQAAPRRVLSQSMTMWFVSLVNLAICEAAAGEAAEVWLKYGDEGLRQWNIKRFPVITRGVQESYAPVHDKLVSAEYEQLRVDPNVQKMIRDKFAYLHQAYEELQERANHLGEVDGRKRKMNIDEFVTLVRGLYARIDRTTDELNEWALTQIEKTPP